MLCYIASYKFLLSYYEIANHPQMFSNSSYFDYHDRAEMDRLFLELMDVCKQEAPRLMLQTFINNVWIPVFEKLFSGLKVNRSSWKTDTKTNDDSQGILKPHDDMHKATLYDQLLLQKFMHNSLLGEMQMFFFYSHGITVGLRQIERSKLQPPEITILSSAPPVSFASSGISLTVDTCTCVTKTTRFLIRPVWI